MCIGIPMQVVEPGAETAVCAGRGARERINCLLVGEQPPGTWVLTFQGTALRVLDADEAALTNDALDALSAVLAGGTDVRAHFADLVDREPELPAHLRGNR
jgi:hydrogenase expression/formation protein HypC